jgi:hypothetical protein
MLEQNMLLGNEFSSDNMNRKVFEMFNDFK